jgi:competence ComEA-like helix-hairpin-helix protein
MRRIYLTGLICLCLIFVVPAVVDQTARGEKDSMFQAREVNISNATAEEIADCVPLISLDLARRIIEYREINGNIEYIEELLDIEGFSSTLLEKVRPFLLLDEYGSGGDDCGC